MDKINKAKLIAVALALLAIALTTHLIKLRQAQKRKKQNKLK
jgi:hypothetical protein